MVRSSRATAPRRRQLAPWFLALAMALLVGPTVAGCSANRSSTPPPATASTQAGTHTMPNDAEMTTAEMDSAWAGRPAFARQNQRTEAAYAFALRTGHVIEWMPCYCGCGAMGHGSNLDCYFKPAPATSKKVVYEEHASYCDICVDITLTAQKLLNQGKSLREIRDAVDRQYGIGAPGTKTALPPA